MNATLQAVRPEPVEGLQPIYLVDNRANLIVENGDTKMIFTPAAALELIKFIERTGYQAHANAITKGAQA